MRIQRLDLTAVGPFTDVSLRLDQGEQGLHLVFGPNEAGKSSSLRALRYLLYGFGHRIWDDFVHSSGNLRVGGVLQNEQGDTLECVRRRGNQNTLRGPDDTTILDEKLLIDMLSGIDEQQFVNRFGIGYEQLVEGGKAITEGKGELGKALFAAASGSADLGEVQRELFQEAEEMFTPRAQVRPINDAIKRWKTARTEVSEYQLSGDQWKQNQRALSDAQKRQTELQQRKLEIEAELQRLSRIQKALPPISRRRAAKDELAKLGDPPRLPANFAVDRQGAITDLKHSEHEATEATQTIAALKAERENCETSPELLACGDEIEQLKKDSAVISKALHDVAGLRREQNRHDAEALELLKQLDSTAEDLGSVEKYRVERAVRQRIEDLGRQQERLTSRFETASNRIIEITSGLRRAKQQRQQQEIPRDPAVLQRAIGKVAKLGDLDAILAKATQELQVATDQIEVDLRKLPGWSGDLAALEALSAPTPETVQRFEQRFNKLASEQQGLLDRQAELERELSDVNQRLDELSQQHDTPTIADVKNARRLRDQGWELIRDSWFGPGPGAAKREADFKEKFPGSNSPEEAYEESVRQADGLVDRVLDEAEFSTLRMELETDRQRKLNRQEQLNTELASWAEKQKQAEEDWFNLWHPLHVEPLTPPEMRSWLTRQQNVATAAANLRRLKADHHEAMQRHQQCHQDLSLAFAEVSDNPPVLTALSDLVAQGEILCCELESARVTLKECDRSIASYQDQLAEAEAEREEATAAVTAWQADWDLAMTPLGLANDATPGEAQAVVAVIGELFVKLKEAGEKRERIAAIEEDAANFADRTQELTGEIAPDLVELPPEQATSKLHARWLENQRALERKQDLNKQEAAAAKRLESATQSIALAAAKIEALLQLAGCEQVESLPEIEQQAERRDRYEAEIAHQEERIVELAAGVGLEAFIEAALAEQGDEIPTMQAHLESELAQVSTDLAAAIEAIGAEKEIRKQMNGEGKAAAAEEEAQQILAQVRDDAIDYARIKLAAHILKLGVERYREKNQGPVLTRASEIFRDLTLGGFTDLHADYGDDGETVLRGVRSDGAKVGVSGMSAGSCDQLYLALRVASLEHHFQQHPPLPFVVDDILLTFDNERAAAALQMLGEFSQQTQVIFFTHHEHLVRVAEEVLPSNLLYVHDLRESKARVSA